MYIPGRLRTASRPSSLSILVASYRSVLAVFLGTFIDLKGFKTGKKILRNKGPKSSSPQKTIYIQKHSYFSTPKSIILKLLKSNILWFLSLK
tara:strand:- start:125 stop:400 length:276 start_codon:yes stop_codon:yes gene_type:complete